MVCQNSDMKKLMERYTGAEFGLPFKCSLKIGEKIYMGEATLALTRDNCRVAIRFETNDPSFQDISLYDQASSLVGNNGQYIPVYDTEGAILGDCKPHWHGNIKPGKWFCQADNLIYAKFSFADLPPVLQQDSISFNASGWNVELWRHSDSDGTSLIHSGVLQRSNKTSFSTEDAYQVLTSMTLAFSLASGNYSIPVLVEGVREDGSITTAMVGNLHTDSKSECNWFSSNRDIDVVTILKAILCRYAKEGHYLRNVVTKYVESELAFRGGAYQAALVMAQSSLEALVKWESKKGTGQIPSLLKGLGFQVTDSEIKSLTDFRNKIAHSDPLVDGFLQDVYRVWNEMQFWSEAWFLKKLGCSGRIKDRRKPWEEHFNLPEF